MRTKEQQIEELIAHAEKQQAEKEAVLAQCQVLKAENTALMVEKESLRHKLEVAELKLKFHRNIDAEIRNHEPEKQLQKCGCGGGE